MFSNFVFSFSNFSFIPQAWTIRLAPIVDKAVPFLSAEDIVTVFQFWDKSVGVTHTPKISTMKRILEIEKKEAIDVAIVAKLFAACEAWPGGVPEQLVNGFSDRVCKEMKTLQPGTYLPQEIKFTLQI